MASCARQVPPRQVRRVGLSRGAPRGIVVRDGQARLRSRCLPRSDSRLALPARGAWTVTGSISTVSTTRHVSTKCCQPLMVRHQPRQCVPRGVRQAPPGRRWCRGRGLVAREKPESRLCSSARHRPTSGSDVQRPMLRQRVMVSRQNRRRHRHRKPARQGSSERPSPHARYRHGGRRHVRHGQTSIWALRETDPTGHRWDRNETLPRRARRSAHRRKPIGQTRGAIEKGPRADR